MKFQPDDNLETTDGGSGAPGTDRLGSAALPTSFSSGRYQVLRLLSAGGQKQVYLARDTLLNRDVVIALLKTQQLDVAAVTRLRREAQAMAQLGDHPNIVAIYDLGEEEGRPFIVSQYIEGGSVSDLLTCANKRPLPSELALRIATEISLALAHAHSRGIVHRDLKPANVWLTKDGTVKLGDFGIALDRHFSRLTLKGVIVGTVAYMPPEQALGHEAEPRSDLYSLGAMLYEMVTGRPPFLGDQLVGIVSQHINAPPVAPSWHNPEIPQALEALIIKLLAKAPEERPESASGVANDLAAIASSSPAAGTRVAPQDSRSLARLAVGVFVGREQETTWLRNGLNEALSGRGRLLMLVGEPGSGKTRTAEQLATYARLRDAQVLVGRCYEGEGAPAFWPWMQIIRSYVEEKDSESLKSLMGTSAADIAQLVSDLRERLPNLPAPPLLEPEQARFRLFDGITNFLKNASKRQPLVIIVDDLHWADKPSLLLLHFLARELRETRMLVVGTYRDVELGRQHPLAQTLAELARQGLSERLVLRGLSKTDVARFIEMTAGLEPPHDLLAAVYKQTEGNPFFVNEVVRLLVSEGRLERPRGATSWTIRIPEGVREVIGRRLDQLSDECNRVLTTASVVGREFSLPVLEALGELSGDRLFEVLDQAVAARVIAEVPQTVGQYAFSHALIRQTLYDELSANRRVRLHRRIAEVLEGLYKSRPEPHLAELAHHFFQAAPGGDVGKAIHYAVRAAERATGLLAYEEAVDHYERALEALELAEPVDEAKRSDLLLALGEAEIKAGNRAAAREIFERAAELSKKHGFPERLARAALGAGSDVTGATGRVDDLQVRLLKDALTALGEGESALKARVLAHLALALYYSPESRVTLSLQAMEMARKAADPTAIVAALYSRHAALVTSVNVEERLSVAKEILRIAEAAGNKEMALRAHYRLLLDLLEIGDIQSVDQEIEAYARLAEELRQPRYLWSTPFFRASRALLGGRFEECEKLAHEALVIGQRAQDPVVFLFFGVLNHVLRVAQGRGEEQVPAVKNFIERYPMIPGFRATLAYVYATLGREAEAREEFEKVAAHDFTDLQRDGSFIVTLVSLSNTCHFLGDSERARKLYELLLPYTGHTVVTGSAAVCAGSTSLPLGVLATTLGLWDEAVGHFENALRMNNNLGARPYLASTEFSYAAMLLCRGRPDEREKALALLDQSLSTAREIGMAKLIEEVEALRSRV